MTTIKAKKSLGQNFLNDESVARRIIDLVSPSRDDILIEVGPGTGVLTRKLVDRSGFVLAVEIDPRLADSLRSSLKRQNLSVITADALKLNWQSVLEDANEKLRSLYPDQPSVKRVRIVANLPYYISTPIIEMFLSLRDHLFDMTLMLQKEVAERITTDPGTKEYGYLSVLVQYYCVASLMFEVPPSAFTPEPKVRSAVIRLKIREQPAIQVEDERRFFALVRAAFSQRRKTILNNLKAGAAALKFSRPIETALEASGITPQRRAETLSLAEFASLDRELFCYT
ncbi:MAG TPA: 16S rRNA (adenine(1518)-N(6)/adenine(1519)-N(6))-dimethyltransferase RsmA [Blastocatellia bacterium]|nr:16S rRNA (adenine(1518)-N(6)/adenine(1519)-N(6))-dimethyltransferase RsmA [Blastocatellia bacterium]